MLIKIKKSWEFPSSKITPKEIFEGRRHFMKSATAVAGAAILPPFLSAEPALAAAPVNVKLPLAGVQKTVWGQDLKLNKKDDVLSYNNFYEFGTGKTDPAKNAHTLTTKPWTLSVGGEAHKPGTIDIEQLVKEYSLEERIYRFRCVETWAMVVPWIGIPLNKVIGRFAPNSNAKYVAFETLKRPEEMPGQRRRTLDWPYVEGLRMDEAMNDLTMLVVGAYGEEISNQNGAPLRLMVPWKYGYKSIKSIVKMTFTEQEPPTSWNLAAKNEYGFYSNVNPERSHPRWSQAQERVLGGGLFAGKNKTLKFNGYGEQVADLYQGMNLHKFH